MAIGSLIAQESFALAVRKKSRAIGGPHGPVNSFSIIAPTRESFLPNQSSIAFLRGLPLPIVGLRRLNRPRRAITVSPENRARVDSASSNSVANGKRTFRWRCVLATHSRAKPVVFAIPARGMSIAIPIRPGRRLAACIPSGNRDSEA
jgi:hypothetical protein